MNMAMPPMTGCLPKMMDTSVACMMNMKSYFHTGTCECLLFSSWETRDSGDYFLFAAILFVVCAVRDGVAIGADVLVQKGKNNSILQKISWIASVIDMVLYGFLVTIEYGIMLIIMSYNVGLFLTIIAGLMLSRFIFYPMTIKGNAMPNACH
eukprot:UN02747